MLEKLVIKNFGIISNLELDFQDGFTVITGETGAGKSMLIDAISLLMGGMANEDMIKFGEIQAVIEGTFKVDRRKLPAFASDFLDEETDQLIVLRKITRQKSAEARVNSYSITNKKLKELISPLVSISGQHEHLLLFSPEHQRYLVDAFSASEIGSVFPDFQLHYQEYLGLMKTAQSLSQGKEEVARRLEFLDFQIKDIEQNQFLADEEETLQKKQKELKYFHLIQSGLGLSRDQLDQIISLFQQIQGSFQKLAGLDNPAYVQMGERIQNLLVETGDLNQDVLQALFHVQDYDESMIDTIESRLDLIFRYKHKYHCQTLSELVLFKQKLITEFQQLEKLSVDSDSLNQQIQEKHVLVLALSQKLSQIRQRCSKQLSELIFTHMKDLHFLHSQFNIQITYDESLLSSSGADKIEFFVSTNLGEPLKVLSEVASGGELSRILLAVKTVFNELNEVDTLIFDEIDTGVGGVTALKIGEKIQLIAQRCQVFCVTHLPQIAKFADHHFVIEKQFKQNQTQASVKILSKDDKISEIQRMVGGEEVVQLLGR